MSDAAEVVQPTESNRLRNAEAAQRRAFAEGNLDAANALALVVSLERENIELRAKLAERLR